MINKLNLILEEHKQSLRITFLKVPTICLNNGYKITTKKEYDQFIKRLKNNKTHFITNFDLIYGLDPNKAAETIKEIKRELCRMAGKKTWAVDRTEMVQKWKARKPWNKGKNKTNDPIILEISNKLRGRNKFNDPRIARDAERRKGPGNPMFGKKHTQEYKKQQSERIRQKILDGSFTPNSNNRYTHFDVSFRDIKFRSSWEAAFFQLNSQYRYEALRIPYIDLNGNNKVYLSISSIWILRLL